MNPLDFKGVRGTDTLLCTNVQMVAATFDPFYYILVIFQRSRTCICG